MDYEDLSAAGQSTPTPPSGSVSDGTSSRRSSSGSGSGGPDQRKILLFAMISGLAMVVAILLFVGLPIWVVAVVVVADVVAMRVMFSRLPPAR